MAKSHKNNPLLIAVAARIKALQKARNLTNETFAALLGTQPPNLHRLTKGMENLTLTRLQHIAEVLQVEVADLLTTSTVTQQLELDLDGLGWDVLPGNIQPPQGFVPVLDLQPSAGVAPQRIEPTRRAWAQSRLKNPHGSAGLMLMQVTGDSMAPQIEPGAWCLFRQPVSDLRVRATVLLRRFDATGLDAWIVKQIGAVEGVEDGSTRVRCDSRNPAYPPQWFRVDVDCELVAELVDVLGK